MITISKTLFNNMLSHGVSEYPHECCGAFFGTNELKNKQVLDSLEIENQSDENKTRRFKVLPVDYMKCVKYAKLNKLDFLGFYHSHPDHPALPSETDRRYAWPNFSYIIFSAST